MASEVDICNLALSHLGDEATVASIDPPEGSPQAGYCARFYPAARDALLETHAWAFAMQRVQLALLPSKWPMWDYTYSQPLNVLKLLAVLPPQAHDDDAMPPVTGYASMIGPQPFSAEVDDKGRNVIYTNQADAVLRYTVAVKDTTKFPPLFVMALSWHLASLLAGPILKGDAGAAEAKRCAAMMQGYLSQAITSDASQRRVSQVVTPAWIAGR